jgi:hypothetical protein
MVNLKYLLFYLGSSPLHKPHLNNIESKIDDFEKIIQSQMNSLKVLRDRYLQL